MRNLGWLATLSVACLGLASNSARSQEAARLPFVQMEDQFERANDVAKLRGDVVVLIYGDRKSADANRELGEILHVTFHPTAKGQPAGRARQAPVRPLPNQMPGTKSPDVHAIAVACIGKVPPLVLKIIRNQIRQAAPEVPVWLDVEEAMKQQFSLSPGVPNVVVLDVQGRYRHRVTGQLNNEKVQQLAGIIDGLRVEAAGSGR